MPTWNASQYLKFSEERTQPCRDLAARVALPYPRRIIDLGCGPGNSTHVLAGRWPEAELTGLDNSADMIAQARASYPEGRWIADDIVEWAAGSDRYYDDRYEEPRYDLVFSNAALQWLPDHSGLLPKLLARVCEGGALAVQIPGNWDAAAHRIMRKVATQFPGTENAREWFTHDIDFYYDVLSPHAHRVELWATEYIHVMDGAEGIVEWYKGTGMRPFLDVLAGDEERARFLSIYLEAIRASYPPRASGRVLFPFRRLFMVAYRLRGDLCR